MTTEAPAAALPVAIIGAGPVGLAAAAHLAERHEPFVVIEAGAEPGAAVREWGHVQVFSPWRYNVDAAARRLLEAAGWAIPTEDAYPTGHELVDGYLAPLAAHPAIAPNISYGERVVAISRDGLDKMKNADRGAHPFVMLTRSDADDERIIHARAVIDASGTWSDPNPLGANGLPVPGERSLGGQIRYGIPDVLGTERARYAGKRVLVVGSGHSAFNALQDLMALAGDAPETRVTWAIRRPSTSQLFGGEAADALPERGSLGRRIRQLTESGEIHVETGVRIERLERTASGIIVQTATGALPEVDEIVAATGFRPDLAMLRELRLDLDPAVESPSILAPMIDPNLHSCGTVPPHGAEQLQHPEPDFYIAGMKSYGRAPTFLMLTGYEQVRSIVAALTGDLEGARTVELVLPETGVCSSNRGSVEAAGCCGTIAESTAIAVQTGCCDDPAQPAESCCGGSATATPVIQIERERRREPASVGSGARSTKPGCC
jgi:thioredoxin reductase